MKQLFHISASPHVKNVDSVPKIMYTVILALVPAGIGAFYFFGIRALTVITVAAAAALITELILQMAMKRPIRVTDGSAILTGILVAYNVPAEIPLWIPVVGSIVGIGIGKMTFGGLGYNPLNPALVGRAFMMASWPQHMTVFTTSPTGGTLSGIDSITSATPLNVFKASKDILANNAEYSAEKIAQAERSITELYNSGSDLFLGKVGGCIGETSALLLLIGGLFLMYKRIIGWKIPFSYIFTVIILSWIFGGTDGLFSGNPLFHTLSGGLMLGAFFMATDMVTTPITFKGRLLFGTGCGILTVVIRLWGGYPEGVSYSILLMNLTTPLIDRYTKPKVLGG